MLAHCHGRLGPLNKTKPLFILVVTPVQNGQHFSCKKVFHLIVLFRFTLCKPHQKRPVAFQTHIITSCFYSLLFGFIKDE